MRTPSRTCAIVLILWLAAACAPRLGLASDAATQAVFDQVRRHDFAAIESRLPPLLRTAVTDARLQADAAKIPDQPAQAVKLVSFNSSVGPAGRQTSVTREYFYTDRVLVISTAILEQSGRSQAGLAPQVVAFNVQPFPRAALAFGRFNLAGKSMTQYFVFALAVLIPLVLVYALVRLARDRTTRWKWLWTLFILSGFTRMSLNWVTGAILFQPISILLLGASVSRGALDVSPWIVSISLPLGALIYLGRGWFAPIRDEPP